MHKIFKPEKIKRLEDAVSIPDVQFMPQIIPEVVSDESEESDNSKADDLREKEIQLLREELYRQIYAQVTAENDAFLEKERSKIDADYKVKISEAEKSASSIMAVAEKKSVAIIEDAEKRVSEIEKKAYDTGLNRGIACKTDTIEKLSGEIERFLKLFAENENNYFEEYAAQLRKLAVEICEKIICQKIEDDDLLMYSVIKSAVKSIRNASWIKAEVSEELSGFIDTLESELRETGQNVEFVLDSNAEKDTCVINTSDGIVIATLSTQLNNLKTYIENHDKGESDEDMP